MQRPSTHINAAVESFVSYDTAVILWMEGRERKGRVGREAEYGFQGGKKNPGGGSRESEST